MTIYMTTQMLESAGFHDVIAEDRTEQVISSECPLVVEQLLILFPVLSCRIGNINSSGWVSLILKNKNWENTLTSIVYSFSYATFQFLSVLRRELAQVEKNKEAFVSDFSQVWKSLIILRPLGRTPDLRLCFFWAPLISSIPSVGRRTMMTLWTAGTRSWNGALRVSRGGGCSLPPSDSAWHLGSSE
jgi:hypothetical protein